MRYYFDRYWRPVGLFLCGVALTVAALGVVYYKDCKNGCDVWSNEDATSLLQYGMMMGATTCMRQRNSL